MFVYLITNTVNGKKYVGQTKQTLAKRFRDHARSSHCICLHSAIAKYGKENFIIESICEPPTQELMDEFEIDYIQRYNTLAPNGYNLALGGDIPPPMSAEERKRLSERMKGNKFAAGLSPSDETRKKLSLANIGKTLSLEHRQKISVSNIGKTRSEEAKRKMSLSRKLHSGPNLGKKFSEEFKNKLRSAHLGKKLSEDAKRNMSLAQRARRLREPKMFRSEESRLKMSISQKLRYQKEKSL